MKCLMMHIISPEATQFWITTMYLNYYIVVFVTLAARSCTVFTPNIGTDTDIYLSKHCAHADQEQYDNGLYCLKFDLHSDMYMHALMKHADHFFRQ